MTESKPVITPEAQKFIATLAKKQDRAWFSTRKDDLQELLHGPVEAVLKETGARLMDVFPAVEDSAPKVFRIYRDVRFSKDKSPFKDHVGGQLSIGRFGIYFHVDGKDVFGAVGPWQMEPAELKAFRAAIVDTDVGPALLKETRKLVKAGFEHMSVGELARAPAGISPTHPCIELLRHKGYALMLPRPTSKMLLDGTLPAFLAKHLKTAKPALDLVAKAMSYRP
jgi:uncharacterized protein (TIGR02453 family)